MWVRAVTPCSVMMAPVLKWPRITKDPWNVPLSQRATPGTPATVEPLQCNDHISRFLDVLSNNRINFHCKFLSLLMFDKVPICL